MQQLELHFGLSFISCADLLSYNSVKLAPMAGGSSPMASKPFKPGKLQVSIFQFTLAASTARLQMAYIKSRQQFCIDIKLRVLVSLKAGVLSDETRMKRDAAVKVLKDTWNVDCPEGVFPPPIRPTTPLGTTAVMNLRAITNRVGNLAAVQALFVAECKNLDGGPIPGSFGHTKKILQTLKQNEAISGSQTPDAKSKVTPRGINSKEHNKAQVKDSSQVAVSVPGYLPFESNH